MTPDQPTALTITDEAGTLRFCPAGLEITEPLSHAEWIRHLRTFREFKKLYVLGLADLVRYGRNTFGDNAVAVALAELEFEIEDTQQALAIGQLTLDFRRDHPLTQEHYYVLGKAELPEPERIHWASIAIAESLSPIELRQSIKNGKVIRQKAIDAATGKASGIHTIQGVLFGYRSWYKKIGGKETIAEWPAEHKTALLEELEPIIELAEALRSTLQKA